MRNYDRTGCYGLPDVVCGRPFFLGPGEGYNRHAGSVFSFPLIYPHDVVLFFYGSCKL